MSKTKGPRSPVTLQGAGPRRIRKICIDAGHGGRDPGALGKSGVREKDVVLDVARMVARALKGDGLEVVMTRSKDSGVPLAERTAIANAANADLFISIHSNAHSDRRLNGVETYYYDTTNDDYALKLASRENSQGQEEDSDLDGRVDVISHYESGRLARRELLDPSLLHTPGGDETTARGTPAP